jgi:thioredoxin-related protein
MEEQNLLHLTLPGYILESGFCCVFLYVKDYSLAKLTFHMTAKKRILKFMPLK